MSRTSTSLAFSTGKHLRSTGVSTGSARIRSLHRRSPTGGRAATAGGATRARTAAGTTSPPSGRGTVVEARAGRRWGGAVCIPSSSPLHHSCSLRLSCSGPSRRAGGSAGSSRGVGVACRAANISVEERLASTVPYLLPLFDGLRYGKFFFQQFPISLLIVEPLAPLIKLYFSVPLASLIAFFSLYYGVVQNNKFNRFVRYNTMQAILLDIGLILPSILEQVFKVPKGGPFLQLYVTLYNTVWIFLIVSVLFSVGSCLTGQKPKIPFIGDGADAQIDRRG